MTRINCHSSLKHYEMYHSGCGGGRNYGSIFNTTYNIDCNGHSGFWGGFGYGLGNAFGGLFSGLFRGGMNFNCFGMGGFGIGGFGFPGFGGFNFGNFGVPSLGGIFGDRSKVSDSEDSEKTESKEKKEADDKKDKECEDPDRQKLADHVASVKTLFADEQNLTPDKLKELYNKIKTDMESSKDEPHHTTTDLKEYESLLNILNDKAKAKGWGEIESEDFGKSSSAATTDPATTDPAATDPAATDPAATDPAATDPAATDPAATDPAATDPAATDPAGKKQKYKTGFTNYDGKTELKDGDVIQATDESDVTNPTKNLNNKVSKITKSSSGKHPQTITIYDKKTVIYTYKETRNGEFIYCSDQSNQEYVLQKNSKGKYELVQYEWHKGFGEKDWSPEE